MAKPDIKIQDVVSLAKEAGSTIMGQLISGIHVEDKADDSPVTAADKMASSLISKKLKALTPTIPVISEEGSEEERQAAHRSPLHWVVDPLDGTKTAIEYANGHKDYDQFGVHIALVENGTPILGVAYFPAMANAKGVTYFTGDDDKAYKQTADAAPKEIRVSKPPFKRSGARVSVHFHEARRPETFGGRSYEALPGVGGQRVCMVAEGAADAADMNDIPQTHRGGHAYKQWDLAAAHAILKAAGGELVSAETRNPVTYDSPDLKVPGAYAGGCDTLKFLGLADIQAFSRRAL